MKAVIYARYSSDNQREESIEGQIRDCRAYAEYNGIEIVGEYIDRAFSAKTADRPDFQRMIADSAKKLFDVVLVWKLDRFARNRYDSAFYRYTLRKNSVRLISIKENISDGPEGIILESMIEGMAEYYSANLSQNVKRGFRENALKGKWNGGAIPLGYKVVDHRLTIDEETAPIVRLIFDMCAGGKTAKEIYNYLKEKQIRRANGKPIGYTTVLYMLGSRTYIGEYNHSGIVIEDGVPSIISKETFDKVQETIKKFSIAPAAHKEENDYLLTTHLYCGKCGALMTSYTGTGKSGKVYRYYICNRARKHECDKKKVDKDRIEDFVVAKTMEFLLKDDVVERLVDLLYDLQYEENPVLPRLESQLAERTKEIDNIVTAIQKGVASDALMQRLNELEEAKRALEAEIKKEQAERPLFTKDQFRMALYNFRKIDTTTKEGKARLIETFIDRIYLYDDHIKIIYNINGKDEEISLDELESSKRPQCGQPPRDAALRPAAQHAVFRFYIRYHDTSISRAGAKSKSRGAQPRGTAILSNVKIIIFSCWFYFIKLSGENQYILRVIRKNPPQIYSAADLPGKSYRFAKDQTDSSSILSATSAMNSPLVGFSLWLYTRTPKRLLMFSIFPLFHATSMAWRIALSTFDGEVSKRRATSG